MRKVSMATRTELVEAIGERYRGGGRQVRGRILDEFVSVTGYHRKHAMRLLRGKRSSEQTQSPVDRRIYGEAVRTALVVLWEASDRLCGKRLRPLIPVLLDAMERHGHVDPAPGVRTQLLAMSAATSDRALREAKAVSRAPRRRGVASTALRRSVPIRTFSDWGDPAPGYVEADLVSHSGPVARGSFTWTLVMTDIATGWTECAPLLVREQTLLIAVLNELRQRLPFPLLGFDTDNDSVFINETVRDYCAGSDIAFTRCRPYRKNDQAWVEQKNGAVVRRLVGYRRFEGVAAATALAELYAASRLFVNFFQPSFKLAEKHRDGARVHKRYHPPATPYDRLLEHPRTCDAARARLRELHASLDPVRLLRDPAPPQGRFPATARARPKAGHRDIHRRASAAPRRSGQPDHRARGTGLCPLRSDSVPPKSGPQNLARRRDREGTTDPRPAPGQASHPPRRMQKPRQAGMWCRYRARHVPPLPSGAKRRAETTPR